MHEAALAQRPREARLDGADQSRRPVGDDQQRVGQPPALEILEEGRAARRVLLRARRQMQQDLLAVVSDAPGTKHRLPRQAGVQPLGHAVDEQVGDRELAEVPPGEGFVLLPQPLGHLADRRATQDAGPARIPERRFDVHPATLVWIPSKSASPSRYPASLGLHPVNAARRRSFFSMS